MDKCKIYKLGIAGFCFANIMLLSFPEYLGINAEEQKPGWLVQNIECYTKFAGCFL